MSWTLRVVQTDAQGRRRTRKVCDLGEIAAPVELDNVGLSLEQAKAVLASLQQSVVQLQEDAHAASARATIDEAGAALATFHRGTQGLGQSLLGAPPASVQEANEVGKSSLALREPRRERVATSGRRWVNETQVSS